ncbi:Debranching enzyme [Heterostelium album PN500]|uniref:Debranching enzyme n=1 Tax=Heterostelium pallidum (strain ATCC 26659 / Pp 5 / PN500) TaxID=670386 RepID=D3BLD1_HETP5|nr:Debranching enzyme [Heterostelium album PN500]EFA77865.1 Debranching enzyme [Heterostelium album PN500]|eukprot:XP_020429993.1 Debranching enzyme [Heterostelium album PN500]
MKVYCFKIEFGRLVAPILTLVIGGNHESSNYFSELPNGGWLCPNIYYMGRSGVVQFGGLRIGALSGIYKPHDYQKGHYEQLPLNDSTMRSIYHTRELDVFKLLALNSGGNNANGEARQKEKNRLDIVFSHDWPQGIVNYGDKNKLYQVKNHLAQDGDDLGSPAGMLVLRELKPRYWFSAHLHVKYAAIYPHPDNTTTKFLALDKVLPNRDFLQILDFEVQPNRQQQQPQQEQQQQQQQNQQLKLQYDVEWLSILYNTKSITDNHKNHYNTPLSRDLFKNLYTDEDLKNIDNRFIEINKLRQSIDDKNHDNSENNESVENISNHHLEIPFNFIENTHAYDPSNPNRMDLNFIYPSTYENPQNIVLNNLLDVVCSKESIPINIDTLTKLDTETYRKDLQDHTTPNQQQQSFNNNNNNETTTTTNEEEQANQQVISPKLI